MVRDSITVLIPQSTATFEADVYEDGYVTVALVDQLGFEMDFHDTQVMEGEMPRDAVTRCIDIVRERYAL